MEILKNLNHVIIRQQAELFEALVGWETNNAYEIRDINGRQFWAANERTNMCYRNCCGANRPYTILITDSDNSVVLRLERPFRCSTCWFPCCLQKLQVFDSSDNLVGSISQNWSCWKPQFKLYDSRGEHILNIRGPCCRYAFFTDVNFLIKDLKGTSVGLLSKTYRMTDIIRELFTDADMFRVSFDRNLSVQTKSIIVAAVFLIDFMYYERRTRTENDVGFGMVA